MESVDFLLSGASQTPDANAAAGGEWQTILLEESLRSETEYCFLLTDSKQITETSRKLDYSMCGLSELTSRDAASRIDWEDLSITASEDYTVLKDVRLSIHAPEDPERFLENVSYESGNKEFIDSGPLLGPGDDECLPLLQQVRAFIKGAKLSCTGLLSGDGKPFFNGWSALLQRSFSFKLSETPSDGELLCKKSNNSGISRTTSTQTPTSTICGTGVAETMKGNSLLVRDPASRAEALPLAHYRPTDCVVWKEEDVKTGLPTGSVKSPVHANCKKPPKPPRHPGRSTSLDSASIAAQRAARKHRERAAAKRRSRGLANAAASTGLSPLVALVLTIGFGILMVFQGVFVQTNVSYGRNMENANVAANSRFPPPGQEADSFVSSHPLDPNLPTSLSVDASESDALVSSALKKSMTNLPWSRSSLNSQVKSSSG